MWFLLFLLDSLWLNEPSGLGLSSGGLQHHGPPRTCTVTGLQPRKTNTQQPAVCIVVWQTKSTKAPYNALLWPAPCSVYQCNQIGFYPLELTSVSWVYMVSQCVGKLPIRGRHSVSTYTDCTVLLFLPPSHFCCAKCGLWASPVVRVNILDSSCVRLHSMELPVIMPPLQSSLTASKLDVATGIRRSHGSGQINFPGRNRAVGAHTESAGCMKTSLHWHVWIMKNKTLVC